MLCQNCEKNEANVRYTQIINGVKKQMILCTDCAEKLGIDRLDFNMEKSFSNILTNMFEEYNNFMPNLFNTNILSSNNYNVFDEEGEFESKINRLLENTKDEEINKKDNKKPISKLEELKQRLEIEIKEERYEDAAKTRDEIKKIEKQ